MLLCAEPKHAKPKDGRHEMKAMILGFAAAAVIALGAAVALNSIGHSTAERFSSSTVRL